MATRKKVLARSDYRALLRDVVKLAELGETKASLGKIESQWQIGKRIVRLKLSAEAGYHNSVIRDLSSDSGLAISTLHQSVRFFETYNEVPSDEGLSWAHYRVLLSVPFENDRAFYVNKVQEGGWSSKQLQAAVSGNLHEKGTKARVALKRPAPSDYIYLAQVLDIVDGDTLDLSIDVGFGVKRELRSRLADIDAPLLDTAKGRAARDFVALHLMQAKTVSVQTFKADKYGRYVVHVFTSNRIISAVDCFRIGQHLNELLVGEKHAVVVA